MQIRASSSSSQEEGGDERPEGGDDERRNGDRRSNVRVSAFRTRPYNSKKENQHNPLSSVTPWGSHFYTTVAGEIEKPQARRTWCDVSVTALGDGGQSKYGRTHVSAVDGRWLLRVDGVVGVAVVQRVDETVESGIGGGARDGGGDHVAGVVVLPTGEAGVGCKHQLKIANPKNDDCRRNGGKR